MRLWILALSTVALTVAACGGASDSHGHSHGGGAHAHVAPRGGLLLTLAEESAHVEVLHDPKSGTLSLYLLDNHAENPVRSDQGTVEVSLVSPSTLKPIELRGVASSLTGETEGDTSHFQLVSPILEVERLEGTILTLKHRDTLFEGVAFALPENEEAQGPSDH